MAATAASPKYSVLTYGDANAALRELGLAQRRQQELALKAQEHIDRIKAQLTKDAESWAAREKSRTDALKAFLRSKHKDFQTRRTVELTFGKIGFRTPPATLKLGRGHSEEDAVAAIKRLYPDEWQAYVQVRESLRRDDIKFAFSIEDLANLGLSLDQKEQPVIEPRLDVEPSDKEAS